MTAPPSRPSLEPSVSPTRSHTSSTVDLSQVDTATLVYYPNPVLRQACAAVAEVTDDVRRLADRMFEIMYHHKGVGLAAPQVGIPLQMFVVNTSEGRDKAGEQVLINPEVIETAGRQLGDEGCLSFPRLFVRVLRPAFARLRALDLAGQAREFAGQDLTARCYLHELDHLNGMLLVDKMSRIQKVTNRALLSSLEDNYRRQTGSRR